MITSDHLPLEVQFLTKDELLKLKDAITARKVVWSYTDSDKIAEMVALVEKEIEKTALLSDTN